ncbi:MAG: SPOR domain-containing protein [Pseudomonadota bacterium]|nr:SPOR domain-containing protein [Pseudomonadota bacterium]MEC7685239.1 SPOR domain-containing protein [Pseudomonadota bacterium]MEC7997790.1 SPOR domain-containing protein [Pseudomonadota bacterium]MEC9086024.1 SPOR domain-containing protein [Pseudomonadota bacterium]
MIFLPIVFDGEGSYEPALTSRIPDPPQITILPEPKQTRPVIIADSDIPAVAPSATDVDQTVSAKQASDTGADTALNIAQEDTDTVPKISESVPARTGHEGTLPQLGVDGLPTGWSVRLGLFSNADNAAVLLERLQNAGYRAYIREIESDEGQLRGVFVGPWLNRELSAGYQSSLQREFQLAGIVVPYEMER